MKRHSVLFLLCLILMCATVTAAPASTYSVIYTISPHPDGSAYWTLEYRTLLASDAAVQEFREEMQHPTIITPDEVKNLMKRSATDASAATGRAMEIRDFAATSDVQTTPTGTFGVIIYSFTWTGFARNHDGIEIGDVFPTGLYLPRDTTLIVRPPPGYTAGESDPVPDQSRGEMTWSGQRSFAAGRPHIVLAASSFPGATVILPSMILVGGTLFLGWWKFKRKCTPARPDCLDDFFPEDLPGIADLSQKPITGDELVSFEERILRMLAENGGELYQSELARRLDAPKSTVSTALNALHSRGAIQKIRKGRENLIRRV